MISKDLKENWAEAANQAYQREMNSKKLIHKGTVTQVLRAVTGKFTHMDDEELTHPNNGEAICIFLDSRKPKYNTKAGATVVAIKYLKQTLPIIQRLQCPSGRDPK